MKIQNLNCLASLNNSKTDFVSNKNNNKHNSITYDVDTVSFGKSAVVTLGDKLLTEIVKTPTMKDVYQALHGIDPTSASKLANFLRSFISDTNSSVKKLNELLVENNELLQHLIKKQKEISTEALEMVPTLKEISIGLGNNKFYLEGIEFDSNLVTSQNIRPFKPFSILSKKNPLAQAPAELKVITLKLASPEGEKIDLKLIKKLFDDNAITMQMTSSERGNLIHSKFDEFVQNYQEILQSNTTMLKASKIIDTSKVTHKTSSDIMKIAEGTQNGITFTVGKLSVSVNELFRSCEQYINLRNKHAAIQVRAVEQHAKKEAARRTF